MILMRENTTNLTPHSHFCYSYKEAGSLRMIGHSACALTTARWCSAPIIHPDGVTWHPGRVWHPRIMTLILDKLFTVCGDFSETFQLRQTCSGVMNVLYVICHLSQATFFLHRDDVVRKYLLHYYWYQQERNLLVDIYTVLWSSLNRLHL